MYSGGGASTVSSAPEGRYEGSTGRSRLSFIPNSELLPSVAILTR